MTLRIRYGDDCTTENLVNVSTSSYTFSADQHNAFHRIVKFLGNPAENFFVLRGYAGTGKTYLLKAIEQILDRGGFVYTSPTNKATKVLRKTLGLRASNCKTIYSLLGVKMVAENEFLTLQFPVRPVDIGVYSLIVIDEASVLNREMTEYVIELAQMHGAKILFVGDKAQLPPVGETESPVWSIKCPSASLEEVMRFDNELLELATHIRRQIQKFPDVKLRLWSNHGDTEGVWKLKRSSWDKSIRRAAFHGLFLEVDSTKAVAWRNRTVEGINAIVRQEIHGGRAKKHWLVGDRILVSEPIQVASFVVAHVDDEGTITECYEATHTFHPQILTYHLTVQFDGASSVTLYVVHEDSEGELQVQLSRLAQEARKDRSKWGAFWALKNSFHRIRYSYALTSHRAQGSTYTNAFIDSADILASSDSLESLRCLYVACTRATTKLLIS